eukprot:TRINITY_DN3912_c0_g3_i1.p1 TRINITY_DN3912_c0_g3~~TRINITY_DN3912_c0_g3_i1.p1  ORF type:complete len:461 (+),score=61.01 TRINITY_DN3912_c0_g3_i1:129-1511(+)
MTLKMRALGLLVVLSMVLVSSQKTEIKTGFCIDDNSCPDLHFCNLSEKTCEHKPVFPMTTREILGAVFLVIVAGLSNAGGLGGGPIISPILIIFFEYRASIAVMIAYVPIFGGSLGNFLFTGLTRNPTTGRRIVNFELVTLCLPLLLMGTLIGAKLNRFLPELAILLTLVILISVLLQKVSAKATDVYKRENALLHAEAQRASEGGVPNYETITTVEPPSEGELKQLLEEEKDVFPFKKLRTSIILVFILIAFNLIKGSKRFPSVLGIEFCGGGYWGLTAMTIAICFAFYQYASARAVSVYESKQRLGFPFEDEFRLNSGTVGGVSCYAFVAGLLAGMAGIGGGTIMSPLLLEYGLSPQSASATSSLTVVFTSFISLSLAVIGGFLQMDQILWFMFLSFLGAVVISTFLNHMVRKYRRQSIILFILLGVIVASLFFILGFGGYKVFQHPLEYLHFRSFCA